jgi:hypothetical protein
MPWLKTVGCDCPDCGPDPCTPGCLCTFAETAGGTASDDITWDVTGQFIIEHDINYLFAGEVDPGNYRLQILADGVTLFDSGCVTDPGGGILTIPAGTTSLRIIITVGCGGTPEAPDWFVEIGCI